MANKVRTRIQLGQCIDCGEQLGRPGDTTRRCAAHAKEHSSKQANRQNPRRAERMRSGCCIDCDEPPEPDSVRCRVHNIKNNINVLEHNKRHQTQGRR